MRGFVPRLGIQGNDIEWRDTLAFYRHYIFPVKTCKWPCLHPAICYGSAPQRRQNLMIPPFPLRTAAQLIAAQLGRTIKITTTSVCLLLRSPPLQCRRRAQWRGISTSTSTSSLLYPIYQPQKPRAEDKSSVCPLPPPLTTPITLHHTRH